MRRRRDDRDRLVEELCDRVQVLERRLDESEASRRRADAIIEQLTQASPAPSVPQEAIAEGANEFAKGLGKWLARLVIVAIVALFSYLSFLASAISFSIDAQTLGVFTALAGVVTGLVGTYLGVRAKSSQREIAEATAAAAERGAQHAQAPAEHAVPAAEPVAPADRGEPQEEQSGAQRR